MSRLYDAMVSGASIQMRYDSDEGIVASSVWEGDGYKVDGLIIEGHGKADCDAALSSLENQLARPENRGTLAQRLAAKR